MENLLHPFENGILEHTAVIIGVMSRPRVVRALSSNALGAPAVLSYCSFRRVVSSLSVATPLARNPALDEGESAGRDTCTPQVPGPAAGRAAVAKKGAWVASLQECIKSVALPPGDYGAVGDAELQARVAACFAAARAAAEVADHSELVRALAVTILVRKSSIVYPYADALVSKLVPRVRSGIVGGSTARAVVGAVGAVFDEEARRAYGGSSKQTGGYIVPLINYALQEVEAHAPAMDLHGIIAALSTVQALARGAAAVTARRGETTRRTISHDLLRRIRGGEVDLRMLTHCLGCVCSAVKDPRSLATTVEVMVEADRWLAGAFDVAGADSEWMVDMLSVFAQLPFYTATIAPVMARELVSRRLDELSLSELRKLAWALVRLRLGADDAMYDLAVRICRMLHVVRVRRVAWRAP